MLCFLWIFNICWRNIWLHLDQDFMRFFLRGNPKGSQTSTPKEIESGRYLYNSSFQIHFSSLQKLKGYWKTENIHTEFDKIPSIGSIGWLHLTLRAWNSKQEDWNSDPEVHLWGCYLQRVLTSSCADLFLWDLMFYQGFITCCFNSQSNKRLNGCIQVLILKHL